MLYWHIRTTASRGMDTSTVYWTYLSPCSVFTRVFTTVALMSHNSNLRYMAVCPEAPSLTDTSGGVSLVGDAASSNASNRRLGDGIEDLNGRIGRLRGRWSVPDPAPLTLAASRLSLLSTPWGCDGDVTNPRRVRAPGCSSPDGKM